MMESTIKKLEGMKDYLYHQNKLSLRREREFIKKILFRFSERTKKEEITKTYDILIRILEKYIYIYLTNVFLVF